MPVIQRKRLPLLSKERILLLLIIVLSLLIAYILITELKKEQPYLILENALHKMNGKHESLNVQILEEGNGYALSFHGKVFGKQEKVLRGELPAYDLDVYMNHRGELFVKDLIDGAWKSAVELELEALKIFLAMPFEMLEEHREYFNEAYFYDKVDHYLILRLTMPAELLSANYYPANVLDCFLYIDEVDNFIPQIIFFHYGNKKGAEIVKRTFTFSKMM